MGNCCFRHNYIKNKRYLVKICPRSEGANMIVNNRVTFNNYHLWYDETEKNNITLGMVINCVNDYEQTLFSYNLHNSIPNSLGAHLNMSIQDYVSKSLKTPGYQCFHYGFVLIPIR